MEGVEITKEVFPATPYGSPSNEILLGHYGETPVAFLPRHGRGHRFNPSNIPVQANIWALKTLGVSHVVAVSAVGSLKEELKPLDVAVPDQLIDRTKNRPNTLFDPIAVHVGFAEPFCPSMRSLLVECAREAGVKVHEGGTYVCMEGPLFSTKAESALHRSWGAAMVGMTALPEAKLAREAEMCYATLALVTDYDVWHETEEQVSVESVVKILGQNIANAKRILAGIFSKISSLDDCPCRHALDHALLTRPECIPEEKKRAFRPFLGKYIDL
ncbi:MAG TPA: S-methyl-5'-thioadenosine phosphorylase [Firmicutes bacterium]|nr:S-methyl-5'-thioadenosine phosphorylase [Bacillota bacterium]